MIPHMYLTGVYLIIINGFIQFIKGGKTTVVNF